MQCTSRYNVIGMDEDFQDDYDTVGIHTNWMFQSLFRPGCYYCEENRYRIAICNVYRYNKEIELCWMEGSYVTMGRYKENGPIIYGLAIRQMKTILSLSIRMTVLVYVMSWSDCLGGNVFSMMAV